MPEYHMKYFTYTNLDGYKMLQCVNRFCRYTDFSAIFTTLLLTKYHPNSTYHPKYHPNNIAYYYHITSPPLLLSHKYIKVAKEYKILIEPIFSKIIRTQRRSSRFLVGV